MKMYPEISVLIPVYKTEKHLKKCIESILKQTFKNWEIIAVNDCSPDNSHRILSVYERADSRIRVVNHAVNRGTSQARFTGLDNALGRYIVFVDSDDWIPANALELLHCKIEEESADIVIGGMSKVLDQYMLFKTKARNAVSAKNFTESIVLPELFDKYFINYFGVNLLPSYMCGKIYRRETLDRASLLPTSFSMFEDMVFNLMLHPYLTKIGFVSEPVYFYRYGGSTSTSTPDFLKNVKRQFLLKQEYIRKYDYVAAIPYIKYELINCFYSHFQNLALLDKKSFHDISEIIREEIKDDIYNDYLFEDIDMSERSIALKSKDVDKLLDIVRGCVKEARPRHLAKRLIARVLR